MSAKPMSEKKMRLRIGVLSAILVGYCSSGLSTGYAELQTSFPEVSIENIMLLSSVLGLTNMASSLLVGVMQRWMSQKTVLVLGLAITLTGIIPVFVSNSFWLLMAVTALIGFGTGMLTGCGPAYISSHFDGEAKTQMLSLKMSVQGAGSIVFSLLGGFLAVYGWQYSYAPFVLVGIALVLCMVLLPHEKPLAEQVKEARSEEEEDTAEQEELARKERDGLGAVSPIPIILIVATSVICMSASTMAGMALHISSWGFGDSSTAGIVIALMSVGMAVGGVVAPKFIAITKGHTQVACLLLAVCGHLLMGFSRNVFVMGAGSLLFGTVYAIYFGFNLSLLSGILKPSSTPLGMSLNAGISSGIYTCGVPLINLCAGLWPWDAATSGFFTMATVLGIVAVILLVTRFEKKLTEMQL